MHISDPNQTVALDSVPEILLHIEVNGICGGLPDFVKPFIGALKAALVFKVTEIEAALCAVEGDACLLILKLDICKAEARFGGLVRTHSADCHNHITVSVIVCGVLYADGSQGLHNALSETDENGYLVFLCALYAAHEKTERA